MSEMDQHEFIKSCKLKYAIEDLPPGEWWEDAHYPVPKCKGGRETVPLWVSDHAVHNILQSECVQHPCVFGWEGDYLGSQPNYILDLFEKWNFNRRQLGGLLQGVGGGNIRKVHDRRLLDEEFNTYIITHCRLNAAKGGTVSGPLNRGKKWCNNGETEKKYTDENGLPEGFIPGRLHDNKRPRNWCNNGISEKHYLPELGLPEGFTPGRLPGRRKSGGREDPA